MKLIYETEKTCKNKVSSATSITTVSKQQEKPNKQREKRSPGNDHNYCLPKPETITINADGDLDTANNLYSWHKLLTPPPKQMIVIDRIHSGARRFVILDFGFPVVLTDVFMPACDDLTSLMIDIWCFEEETDSVRLVVAPDIGTRSLVLSDLQSPPVCRYMKITVVARIGISSPKCKIPIGSFFGHIIALESDGYTDLLQTTIKYPPKHTEIQIKALTSLHEDVHCRYSLASCKLLELLTPLLNADITNVAHMHAFINSRQREDDVTSLLSNENSKIVTLYEVSCWH